MQRRDFLKTALFNVSSIFSIGLIGNKAFAAELSASDMIKKQNTQSGTISIIAPSIAEDGQVVPIKIEVNKPVEDVKAIHLCAPSNPMPRVFSAYLTPELGKAAISTRVKLAQSQDVFVLVELNDGTFLKNTKNIEVTLGGCSS